ncbi:hypothetical protein [Streptomyces longwoodensis]|uniref:hypothetical protein n=1 Tax=Streptomyces longwoodensis TaxID=68231 RepID=UPI00384D3D52
MLRRYTVLRTTGPNGVPARYDTTQPPGTVIKHPVNGHPQRFELTDVPLGDFSYVAEPLDHLWKGPPVLRHFHRNRRETSKSTS